MADYRIELGIGLKDGDFNDVKNKIKSLENDGIKIKLDTNTVDAQIKGIKTQLQGLGNIGIDLGANIKIDSNAAIKSAQQVGQKIGTVVTKSVKQSVNIDDVIDKQVTELMKKFSITGEKGSKSFNAIRQALVECRNELNILKNGNFSIDEEVFGTSAAVDKVTKAIAKQMSAVNDLGDEYIKLANYITEFNDPKKGYKVRVPSAIKQEQGDDYKSNRGSLGIAFNTETGNDFADFVKSLNQDLGQTIDLTKGEAEAFEELVRKVKLGREQRDASKKSQKYIYENLSTEEILEQNGINREEIYADTMSIVSVIDAAEDKIAKASIEATNVVIQNEERKQQEAEETANKYESVAKQVQHSNKLISDSAQSAVDNISSKSIDKAFRVGEGDSLKFKQEMENLVGQWTGGKGELTDIKIDTSSVYDKDTERYIEKIRQAQVTYNNELGETIKKTIAWRQIGTEVKVVDGETMDSPLMGFVEVSGQYSKSLGKTKVQTDAFIKQQKQAVSNLTNQINQLNRAASDQNATRPIKDVSHLDTLKSKYNEVTSAIQRLENASTDTFSDEQNNVRTLISEYKSLVSELRNAENVSSKMKGTDFDSGLDIAKNDLEKFKAQAKDFPQITATVKELDRAIENVGDVSSLNKFNDQLRVARSELAKVKSETTAINRSEKVGINVSGLESKITDLRRISPEIDKFETEIDGAKVSVQSLLSDLKKVNTQGDFSVINSKFKAFSDAAKAAGIAVTETVAKAKSALANDIKLDIELGNFENEMDAMRVKFNSLSDANNELRLSYNATKDAYRAMMNAANTNTGDEVADRERLIQAEKEYAAAIEKTNNLIKIQARADKIANDAEKLADKKTALKLDMANYLKDNSRAAKEFGDEIRRLSSLLDNVNLDDIGVNKISRTFKNLTKEIKNAGKDGLTVFDRLKSKAKEYMTYLSAAEVFMWVEQAARAMFDTVLEIDTAMTGLYRVTDLTAAEYDTLFNNMIDSAKEYGATLNDIINATTDWVRAGFEADTALGLAEVTTMYQHISDLDYDTAAENLITAYNGFKDELNGAFNGDQVAAVEYIADIFNELDNNFAVTSAGLGEALTRSASALDLAGNTIQETAG